LGSIILPQSQILIVQHSEGTSTQITEAEYFFDQDPGNGKGFKTGVHPGSSISINTIENLQNVTQGLHRLYFRAKDNLGVWGIPQSQIIIVERSNNLNNVAKIEYAEYFFDTDPGIGLGTSFNIVSDFDLFIIETLPISNLTKGLHKIIVRVRDEAGQWSIPIIAQFEVLEDISTSINSNNPGEESAYRIYGGKNKLIINAPADNPEIKFQIKVYTLTGALVINTSLTGSQKITIERGIYIVDIIDDMGDKSNKNTQKILVY